MASPLTQRALQTIGDSGFTKAKKLADLAIKTNADSSGKPTARGYEQAIAILQPYISSGRGNEGVDAQRLIAGYGNTLDKISTKEKSQNETVAAFKLQENDAYFSRFDGDVGGFRNPASLVDATSESLDNIVLGVVNAIDEKDANGESTDALYSYLNDVQKRADQMRDLKNKFESGAIGEGQVLDGYGYYVDTNPIDGSIRGAAFLPVGSQPDGLTSGFKRLEATTKVGGALVPVYAPAQKDSMGDYVVRVGDATWRGQGDQALQGDRSGASKNLFKEGEFSIADRGLFTSKKSTIDNGQFGTGLIGRDEQGNPVTAMLYRGNDGKLYKVDQSTIEKFSADPILKAKLDGYVPRFSPTEMKDLVKEAQPLPDDRISKESRLTGFQNEAAVAQAESDRLNNMGFFAKVGEGFKDIVSRPGVKETVNEAIRSPFVTPGSPLANPIISAASSFFSNKNRANKPDQPQGVGDNSPDIVEQGKKFFRKVGGFFGGK